MKSSTLVVLLGLSLASICMQQAIAAETSAEQVKGYCGSGATNALVPENFMGCEFSNACKAHDVCYSKCDPGGSMHGSAYCGLSESSPERVAAKAECDDRFRDDIIAINLNRKYCEVFAGLYRRAVVIAGQGPFNGRELSPEVLQSIVERSATPAEAENIYDALIGLSDSGIISAEKVIVQGDVISADLLKPVEGPLYIRGDALKIPKKVDALEIQALQKLSIELE